MVSVVKIKYCAFFFFFTCLPNTPVHAKLLQSCPTLCDPMDLVTPGGYGL